MTLPSDYLDVVRVAADVLKALGARVRLEAARHPEMPELWLTVRDYEGLAARLAGLDDWSWRNGFDLEITGQDVGVINEALEAAPGTSTSLSEAEHRSLARLKAFLDRYRDGD